MTSLLDDRVVVNPNGLIVVCSWCVPRERLAQLEREYPDQLTHTICKSCERRAFAEEATS